MVMVDTSVWVSHLRDGNTLLPDLVSDGMVLCHPLIAGELACGDLQDKADILSFLKLLPISTETDHEEVLSFIGINRLMERV